MYSISPVSLISANSMKMTNTWGEKKFHLNAIWEYEVVVQ